jgi:hypothetical protein
LKLTNYESLGHTLQKKNRVMQSHEYSSGGQFLIPR